MASTNKVTHYNHLIDIAFSVEGPWEQLEDIPMEIMLAALQKRIQNIREENTIESFGLCDTYEVEVETNGFDGVGAVDQTGI